MNLETYPAPEFILHQLVTDIKGGSLADLVKIAPLVKSDGRKYLKGILFLDQGQFQMFPIGPNCAAIAVVNHIL